MGADRLRPHPVRQHDAAVKAPAAAFVDVAVGLFDGSRLAALSFDPKDVVDQIDVEVPKWIHAGQIHFDNQS